MSSAVEEHVVYQISNAPVREYPYPHFYLENVFPANFYAALRANWPDTSVLTSLADTGLVSKGAYPERFVLPMTRASVEKLSGDRRAFWTEFADWFMAPRFMTAMIDKFEPYVRRRFGEEIHRYGFHPEPLIVRDMTNYAIGPHTDAPHRLLSLLFYCPDDASMKHLGTSIYVPLDPEFRCEGGPHYPHERFQKVMTMEYKPNSLFAFFKNDHSFHGVEPIKDEHVQRDVLLYDIHVLRPKDEVKPADTIPGSMAVRMLRGLFGSK